MKKKILALTALLAAAAALTGCGGKTDQAADGGKMTISWLGVPYNSSAQEGTDAELMLEEKFNVEIKPIFYASANYNDKKTMLMAGGETPDIIYEMDPSNVVADAEQGFLSSVDYKTIAKTAPTVYNVIKENAPKAWLYSRVEDENYGIPNLNYGNMLGRLGVWRMDWLKKVGIDKVPETIEEMHDALYKITFSDPDGNGKKDTYGMTGDITNWHTMFTEVFGAYGVLPYNWMEQDGKVIYGGFADGITDAIDTISAWYKEGIIHPDFITDNVFESGKEKFTSGNVGYINQNGGYIDPASTTTIAAVTKQIYPEAEVVSSKFVKGPDGKSGTQSWGAPCHIVCFGAQLQKDEAKLQKILEIFEGTISDAEFLQNLKMGKEGEIWQLRDKEKGFKAGFDWITPYDDNSKRTNSCIDNSFGSPSFFVPVTPSMEVYKDHIMADQEAFTEEYKMMENGLTDAFLKPDTLPSSADCFADLRTQQINILVKAIKGEISSADYLSEFRAAWEKGGGLKLEEEAKELSSTIDTIVKEVEAD
ncbi:MAG: extracellular solute-binding protein [Clostridia bacterium]|nr:extracellular solute-binding protein [Clostridia bacterium]